MEEIDSKEAQAQSQALLLSIKNNFSYQIGHIEMHLVSNVTQDGIKDLKSSIKSIVRQNVIGAIGDVRLYILLLTLLDYP